MKEIKSIKVDDMLRCINRHVLTVMIEPEGSVSFITSLRIVKSLLDCLYVMTDYDVKRAMKETNIGKIIEYL